MTGEDPYVYPGTRILINKRGIQDAERLAEAERLYSGRRAATLPKILPLTSAGYRAIHGHLFQDLYAWAGQDRTVQLAKGNSLFCDPAFIARELDKRFALLKAEDHLRGTSQEAFAAGAARHICEINAIHPFREGNGRTQRAFLVALGREAGHTVDLTKILPEPWNSASRTSFNFQVYEPMAQVIAQSIRTRDIGGGAGGGNQPDKPGHPRGGRER